MASPLLSLVNAGTKLWLDSIDPKLVALSKAQGATGATSNPIIVANLVKSGAFDKDIEALKSQGKRGEELAWLLTDQIVSAAEKVFFPVFEATKGNDGYVSFEVDPLIEDPSAQLPHAERVAKYIELGLKWAKGHPNRLIKVPATPAGIEALTGLTAQGVNLNVTLIFTERQYLAARDAVVKGLEGHPNPKTFKSVYSIFVSRLDVYTEEHVKNLPASAQGLVGIVNAKRIWRKNKDFWASKNLPLAQEMIFASTGTKKPSDPKYKYVAAFAGSDIETNPPETNEAVEASGQIFKAAIAELPSQDILDTIDQHVDFQKLEEFLMNDGIKKFADPQKALLAVLG
jgi:transaldolase